MQRTAVAAGVMLAAVPLHKLIVQVLAVICTLFQLIPVCQVAGKATFRLAFPESDVVAPVTVIPVWA